MKSISASVLHPAFFSLFLLVLFAGCQQRAASKLQGRWEGRPDSAATRAARDAEKYGDETASEESPNLESARSTTEATLTEHTTDWETYDATIVMDFVDDQVEMSFNGEQSVSGSWNVLATSPSGCTIEVQTSSQGSAEEELVVERRRFELLLDEREGICVGFQLTEVGADALVGALYFQRPKASSGTQQN